MFVATYLLTYLLYLSIDSSKAFGVVNHKVLLHKVDALSLPAIWIVSVLTRRQQICIVNGSCSLVIDITRYHSGFWN